MNYMNYVKKFQKCLASKKNDPKHFLCIFLAIMGIYFLGKIAQSLYNRFVITESFDNSTKKGDPSDASEFLLLHMSGCGYCKKMMPAWNKFVGANISKITPKMVERKEDPSLMDKYNVTSFPTILLVDSKGDKIKSYEGDRTALGFQKFCDSYA